MKFTEELRKRLRPEHGEGALAAGRIKEAVCLGGKGAGRKVRHAVTALGTAARRSAENAGRAVRSGAGALVQSVKRIPKDKRMLAAGLIAGLAAGSVSVGTVLEYTGAQRESEYESAASELGEQISQLEEKNALLESENAELRLEADDSELAHNNAEILAGDSEEWMLVLVNEEHPLETTYEPASLTQIDEERSVDSRIAENLQQMMADGAAQGLNMYVTSAYRSYERQREVFNSGMQTRINSGMTPLEAYEDTKKSIAVPGTSEHATGLAVDIIAAGYSELDERQADTAEQQWLMAHCWEYGFILRYPDGTSDITGIIYEPWHYRYVGKEAAREITEQGITMEEYLGE